VESPDGTAADESLLGPSPGSVAAPPVTEPPAATPLDSDDVEVIRPTG